MKYQIIILVCLSLLVLFPNLGHNQSISDYKKQREMLNSQLELLDRSLEGKKIEKQSASENFQLLLSQIANREKLNSTIQNELTSIDSVIVFSSGDLDEIRELQIKRKGQLKRVIRMAHYQKLMRNPWMELAFGRNLKEALLTWRNTQKLKSYVKKDLQLLDKYSIYLRDTIEHLSNIKNQKSYLLDEEELNIQLLNSAYESSKKVIDQLSKDEKRLKNELKRQQDEKGRLNFLIGNMILEEGRKNISSSAEIDLSTLSTKFAKEKGLLSWPVHFGVVTDKFGIKRHPSLRDVKTNNLGIDMLCQSGADIHSIFSGRVLMVTNQPPYMNIVIVSHGKYTSAYYYLKEVFVSKDERLKVGQKIGELSSVKINAKFHFELWEDQTQVNPELWLQKKLVN